MSYYKHTLIPYPNILATIVLKTIHFTSTNLALNFNMCFGRFMLQYWVEQGINIPLPPTPIWAAIILKTTHFASANKALKFGTVCVSVDFHYWVGLV